LYISYLNMLKKQTLEI